MASRSSREAVVGAAQVHRQPLADAAGGVPVLGHDREEALARGQRLRHGAEHLHDLAGRAGALAVRPGAGRGVEDPGLIEPLAAAIEVRHRDLAAERVPEDALDRQPEVLPQAHEIVRRSSDGVRRRRALREPVHAQIRQDEPPRGVRRREPLGQRAQVGPRAEDAVEDEHPARGRGVGCSDEGVLEKERFSAHGAKSLER
jgi:hypothetical protein